MSENMVEWNKPYAFEGNVFVLVTDESVNLELDFTLFYAVTVSVKPVNGAATLVLPEAALQEDVFSAVMSAYSGASNRLSVEDLRAGRPAAALVAEARRRLNDLLSAFDAEAGLFNIEKHWLSDADETLLDSVLQSRTLLDPKKAAEALLQKTLDFIADRQWICPCGRTNNTRYCPECGRPALDGRSK